MTHTLETTGDRAASSHARLRLNEDLVEAIGLGHDMGHTPFGHAGEAGARRGAARARRRTASRTTSSRCASPSAST